MQRRSEPGGVSHGMEGVGTERKRHGSQKAKGLFCTDDEGERGLRRGKGDWGLGHALIPLLMRRLGVKTMGSFTLLARSGNLNDVVIGC